MNSRKYHVLVTLDVIILNAVNQRLFTILAEFRQFVSEDTEFCVYRECFLTKTVKSCELFVELTTWFIFLQWLPTLPDPSSSPSSCAKALLGQVSFFWLLSAKNVLRKIFYVLNNLFHDLTSMTSLAFNFIVAQIAAVLIFRFIDMGISLFLFSFSQVLLDQTKLLRLGKVTISLSAF